MFSRKKKDKPSIFEEFRTFITRGNVIDLAVGVIIGGAFSAVVTSFTNKIVMPLINALIALCTGGKSIDIVTILNGEERFLADGTVNPKCIYIDWGNFINVIINFLLIALVLFSMVKIANTIASKKAQLDAKLLEDYYKKHPEERPAPVEPGAPVPTELDVLNEIRDLLKAQQADKKK